MRKIKTKLVFPILSALLLIIQSGICVSVTRAVVASPPQINFTINPSNDSGQGHLSYEIKPTKSVEDIMTIKNNSDQTIRLKIYAVDSTQSSDGAVAFKLSTAKQETVGLWLKLNSDTVEIAPLKSIIVPYTINIPEQVTPGTYQGALVAEIAQDQAEGAEGKAIKVSTRLTEPLYISIPGRKTIDYSLDQFTVDQSTGNPTFHIRLINQGNVFLKTEASLSITGLLLQKPYEISLNKPTILQGDSYEKTVTMVSPPLFGNYEATISFLVSEYNPATGKLKALQPITRTVSFFILPLSLLIGLAIIIILAIFSIRHLTSRHN